MIRPIIRVSAGLATLAVILFSSCDSSRHKGFEETEDGLYYQFHRQDEAGKSPQIKDILYTHMSLSIKGKGEEAKDSLLFDSFSFPDYPEGIKFIQLSAPAFKGDVMEGLAMMHIGDSASFIVSADSFFLISNKLDKLPPGLNAGDELLFNISLVEIQSEAETLKRLEALRSQMNTQQKGMMDKMQAEEPAAIEEYLKRKNLKGSPSASGMYFFETAKGNGPLAKKGQKVTMQYTGYLLNGKKFDSSFDHGEPFTFKLGAGEVIAGWEEGVAMMHVGSSATFVIPSVLGYGSNGQGPIPPFSPLVFEVQLMKAE
ncbi:MAG TPA: FKBP-type peptidyl-prolyl cis-trans isomerase [Flavobacteriales bacterium]|nr:FKBP-type peptidyl-prolyl cis-trans isomerase [Flavobacteriales bacterium]